MSNTFNSTLQNVFKYDKAIYNFFEEYRTTFNKIFIFFLIIFCLILFYFIIASIFDLRPLFFQRKLLSDPKILVYNPNTLENINRFYNSELQDIIIDFLNLGGTPEILNRRHFVRYDYTIKSTENSNILLYKQGSYSLIPNSEIIDTTLNLVIPVPIVKFFEDTLSFNITITRRIGYSNYIINESTSTELETGEFISNIISKTDIITNYNLPSDLGAYYYTDTLV